MILCPSATTVSEDTFYCDRMGLCALPAEARDAAGCLHSTVQSTTLAVPGLLWNLEPPVSHFFRLLTKQDTGEKQTNRRNVLEGALVFSFKSEVSFANVGNRTEMHSQKDK